MRTPKHIQHSAVIAPQHSKQLHLQFSLFSAKQSSTQQTPANREAESSDILLLNCITLDHEYFSVFVINPQTR